MIATDFDPQFYGQAVADLHAAETWVTDPAEVLRLMRAAVAAERLDRLFASEDSKEACALTMAAIDARRLANRALAEHGLEGWTL